MINDNKNHQQILGFIDKYKHDEELGPLPIVFCGDLNGSPRGQVRCVVLMEQAGACMHGYRREEREGPGHTHTHNSFSLPLPLTQFHTLTTHAPTSHVTGRALPPPEGLRLRIRGLQPPPGPAQSREMDLALLAPAGVCRRGLHLALAGGWVTHQQTPLLSAHCCWDWVCLCGCAFEKIGRMYPLTRPTPRFFETNDSPRTSLCL